MSDEMQNSPSAAPAEEPVLSRAERRAARRAHRSDATPWLGGTILIMLGLVFLAQNLGIATLKNWWALFILIPAVGGFTTAWRKYQADGHVLTSGAVGSLIGGLIFTAVALAFLFDLGLNASLLWPVLLIIGGVAVLLQAVSK